MLVNSLGWALAFRSGVDVLLARIHAEEKLLHSQFGAYRSRTARLISGLY